MEQTSENKNKDGGELKKGSVEHFGKIQKLESELIANKFDTYKQMESTYKQLLRLKNEQLTKASKSCLQKQLMDKVNKPDCAKSCLRDLQKDPKNNKIKCGCKKFPVPFTYSDC